MSRARCPKCQDDNLKVVKVTFECAKGHQFIEEVELPGEGPPPATEEEPRRRLINIPSIKSNPANLTMPFGKHKGELIENLPTDYINWCLENLEKLSLQVRNEMENQLVLREGKGVVR
jgi:uncharacterized protein (DUF3820 family)